MKLKNLSLQHWTARSWFLAYTVTLVIVGYFAIYRTNDDPVMTMVLKGVGFAESASPYTVFHHYFFSYFLYILFSWLPLINWYFFLINSAALAFFFLLWRVHLKKFSESIVLHILLFFIIIPTIFLYFNFTSSAIFIGLLGIISFHYGLLPTIYMFATFVLASTIRLQAGQLVLSLFFFMLVMGWLMNYDSVKLRRNLRVFAGLIASYIFLYLVQNLIYSKSDWKTFVESNNGNSCVHDYYPIADANFLVEGKISQNDYSMLMQWNVADKEVFTPKVFKSLAKVCDHRSQDYLFQSFISLLSFKNMFLWVVISILCFLWMGKLGLYYCFFSIAMYLFIGLKFKMVDRIQDLLLLFPVLMAYFGGIAVVSNSSRVLIRFLLFVLVCLSAFRVADLSVSYRHERRRLMETLSVMKSLSPAIVMVGAGVLKTETLRVADSFEDFREVPLFGLGVTAQSPLNDGWYKKMSSDNVYLYMLNNKKAFQLLSSKSHNTIAKFYLEHYKKEIRFELVARSLYRIEEVSK